MRLLPLSLALLLGGISASAAAADLEQIRNAAWQADSQWAAARKTWQAQQENLTQGRAGLLPSLNAEYDQYKHNQDISGGPSFDYDSKTTSLSLVQPLFRPGAWFGYEQSKAATSGAQAQFQQARQDFLLRVSEQYLGVLRAWDNLVSARAEDKALQRQLEQTKQRYNVGLVAVTDVDEAQAAFDISHANLIGSQSDFEVARDKLEALTGKRWDQLDGLRDDLPMQGPQPDDAGKWVSRAQAGNPQVLAAQYSAKSAHYSQREKLSQQLPSVDLVGQWQRNEQPFTTYQAGAGLIQSSNIQTTSRQIGIQVKLPLFAGGALNSQRKQAAYQSEAAKEQYRQAYRDAGQQARSLFRTVKSDVLRVKARKQALQSARSALKATQSGYEVGTRNIVDVLNSQKNLYSAQRDYANSRYDYILDSLKLKSDAGMLEENDIKQINGWLSASNSVNLYPNEAADNQPSDESPSGDQSTGGNAGSKADTSSKTP